MVSEQRQGPMTVAHEREARDTYMAVLDAWNRRDAATMAGFFADDGICIGFDGSTMFGPQEIATTLSKIFDHHATGRYVPIIRSMISAGPEAVALMAVVGMVPAGATDINPAINAVQTIVVARRAGAWRTVLLQSTPAAYHGRPEASEQLTTDLRAALRAANSAQPVVADAGSDAEGTPPGMDSW